MSLLLHLRLQDRGCYHVNKYIALDVCVL